MPFSAIAADNPIYHAHQSVQLNTAAAMTADGSSGSSMLLSIPDTIPLEFRFFYPPPKTK